MAEDRQEAVKTGEILFLQGSTPREIIVLNSGSVEILTASAEYDGLDSQIILDHSKRVALVKEKGIIAGYSRLFTEKCRRSVRAVEDCSISRYELGSQGYAGLASSDPNMASSILRQVYNRVNSSINEATKFSKLYQHICTISDNISLIYKELSGSGAPMELDSKAATLHGNFSSSSAKMPENFSAKFLVTDNSRYLSRRYEIPGESMDLLVRNELEPLIKRLLMLDKNIFNAAIKADSGIALSICETLCDIYIRILDRIESAYGLLDRELNGLFGPDESWSYYLVNTSGFNSFKSSGRLSDDFVKNFLSIVVKLNNIYEDITGSKLTAHYPGIKMIHDYYTSSGPAAAEQKAAPAASSQKIVSVSDLKNSLKQIFEFTLIDKEFQNRFLKLLNDFKTSKNPFSTESDGRKMRSHISRMYWSLYQQAFIRSKIESTIPKPVNLMLNFGFIDETLMDDEQLVELNQILTIREKETEIPVLRETDFLSLIYEGRESPSITEMGLTYEAHLREEEKHRSKKRDDANQYADENIKMTMYEIEHRLASTSAVCSGSTATAFPVLNNHSTRGSLRDLLCTREKVESVVKSLMDIDFSLFYRETVLKINDAREIIQEEVTPYIILLPVFGSRTLLWQELSGTNKRSRSRIVMPIFFVGDLEKNMAHTMACFRWELNRSVKGAMWADPIEGGVTGEYFDYVNTYKKNTKLSAEAKEKITEKFRGLRTNRDRFADDYMMWLLYEKDGIMKLNNVVREMFFKHIPFKKQLREQLENMPAFSHYANRYNNVQTRTIQAYERRFKKYQDASGNYPGEIENFFEFLKT